MLVGNLMALRQVQVKRLLAYSSLTHVGYMLVGIGIAIYAGQLDGSQGGFFHMFNHGMMKGLAFLAAGALLYTLHLAAGDHKPLMIQDLSGASRRYPLAALTFSMAVLALGAIPPLAGFMSEWQIFTAGFETRETLIAGLIILAAFNSVFSLVYYVPLVNVLYRRETSDVVKSGSKLPRVMTIPLIILTAGVIIVGIWPSLMNWLTVPAGLDLLAAFSG
jgi:formate hydrogenlyase subunit 3/multisubunit Na+/H+ antiporter MnhD subunit